MNIRDSYPESYPKEGTSSYVSITRFQVGHLLLKDIVSLKSKPLKLINHVTRIECESNFSNDFFGDSKISYGSSTCKFHIVLFLFVVMQFKLKDL